MKKVRYIDLPKGARFKHNPDDKDVWIVLKQHGRGEIARELPAGMLGRAARLQSLCCVTEEGQLLEDVEVYLVTPSVWVLTSQYNDYDQHGEYLVKVYFSKPTEEELAKEVSDPQLREWCLTKGGGRPSAAYDKWFHLNEVDA